MHQVSPLGKQLEVNGAISFSASELAYSEAARDQPLIIQAKIGESLVMRILVDTGSTKDIMFLSCFKAMGLSEAHFKPVDMYLEGFTNHRITPKGQIELEMVIGEGRIQKSRPVKFVVADLDSPHNVILGTPLMVAFGMVMPVAHQRVKFITPNGVGCVRSDSISYYNHLIKEKKAAATATGVVGSFNQ